MSGHRRGAVVVSLCQGKPLVPPLKPLREAAMGLSEAAAAAATEGAHPAAGRAAQTAAGYQVSGRHGDGDGRGAHGC